MLGPICDSLAIAAEIRPLNAYWQDATVSFDFPFRGRHGHLVRQPFLCQQRPEGLPPGLATTFRRPLIRQGNKATPMKYEPEEVLPGGNSDPDIARIIAIRMHRRCTVNQEEQKTRHSEPEHISCRPQPGAITQGCFEYLWQLIPSLFPRSAARQSAKRTSTKRRRCSPHGW